MEKIKPRKLRFTTRRRGWRKFLYSVAVTVLWLVIFIVLGLLWDMIWGILL